MKAIICAAGFGSRLKLNIPKAMVMIDGKRIIDYQIQALKNYDEIFVVVGFKSNLLIDHLKKHSNIKIIVNKDPSLGIMHTMRLISEELNELVLILDGDIIFSNDIPLFDYEFVGIKDHTNQKAIYCETNNSEVLSFGFKKSDSEWACIYCTNPRKHDWNTDFVYETLSRSLPTPFVRFDCFEIDTPVDKDECYGWLKKRKIKEFWISRANSGNLLWRDLTDLNFKIIEPFINKKSIVLDLGAGDCKLANLLCGKVNSITAVDYIPKHAGVSDMIKFITSDILKYESDELYDLVLLFGVSNSLDDVDVQNLYHKIKKMIIKTGALIVKHQCGRARKVVIKKYIDGLEYNATYRTAAQEVEFINKAGFRAEIFDPYPDSENKWLDTHFKAFRCIPK